MNGIEKIIARIAEDAAQECERILAEARAQADEIVAAGRNRAATVEGSYGEKIEAGRELMLSRTASSADAEKRAAALKARSELVSEVFDVAAERVKTLPEDKYFALLEKLYRKVCAAREADCTSDNANDDPEEFDNYLLSLNAAESARYGVDLLAVVPEVAGKPVVLSDTPCDIDGGFIFTWGNVSVNCSISKIIDAARETMELDVYRILFPQKDQ